MEHIFSIIIKFLEAFAQSIVPKKEAVKLKSKELDKLLAPVKEIEVKKEVHVQKYLWILDNGHGDTTPGKRSPKFDDGSQLFEYAFNREVVSRVADALDKHGVAYLNLVKTDDDMTLASRVGSSALVDAQGLKKVYVSVHANAASDDWSSASGVETYCFPGSSTGHSLASVFQKHIVAQTGWKDRGVKESNFYVLRKTSMPAILTENGFFTNKEQCEQMMTNEYKDKIANAHVQAILEIEEKGI